MKKRYTEKEIANFIKSRRPAYVKENGGFKNGAYRRLCKQEETGNALYLKICEFMDAEKAREDKEIWGSDEI